MSLSFQNLSWSDDEHEESETNNYKLKKHHEVYSEVIKNNSGCKQEWAWNVQRVQADMSPKETIPIKYNLRDFQEKSV